MKMKNGIFVSLLLALMLVSCGDQLREEVVSTYENGQPAKAYYYDKENQWVYEKDFHENGALMMEGPVADHVRNGAWTSYFQDGKVQSEGIYQNGKRIGKSKIYHENGSLWMDGWYADDHKCGEWVIYDEQGYEVQRVNFGSCD